MTRTARAELAAALERIPRVALAALPTPLDAAPRLAAALDGPEIWIKRDDLTGLCFGGNKTRQLEFVFADVLAKGCDTVVAGAYTQSNWCRQMTAAAGSSASTSRWSCCTARRAPSCRATTCSIG